MLVFRMLARYPFAKYSLVGSTAWAIARYAYFRNNYDSKSKWIWQPFNQTQKQMFYAETTAAIRNCTRETTTSLILSDINNLWNTCSSRIHSLFFLHTWNSDTNGFLCERRCNLSPNRMWFHSISYFMWNNWRQCNKLFENYIDRIYRNLAIWTIV